MTFRLGIVFTKLLREIAEGTPTPCQHSIPSDGGSLLSALVWLYGQSIHQGGAPTCVSVSGLHRIDLYATDTNQQIKEIEHTLRDSGLAPSTLFTPVTYFIDELICNIQQHAGCKEGFIYLDIDPEEHVLEICIADWGISIYGSYVKAQRYLEYISSSPAEALSLAKDGFSTKNRPEAENRGYGISTNSRMVVEGLGGEFAILSGSAIFYNSTPTGPHIIGLPDSFEWPGTAVVARIPLSVPTSFSFYDYIA